MNKPWLCYASGRFGSSCWDFTTFDDAMDYAREQYQNAVLDASRFPSYQGILSDYRARITGPDNVDMTLWHQYFRRFTI